MTTLWPNWFNKLLDAQKKFILEKRGMHFIFKFLFKKGMHLFIIGTSGSGKTQKGYWLVRWIATTKEMVIWLDSAKNREIVPLLKLGYPINVIVPKGCDVEFTEYSEEEGKYVRMKDHPIITHVPDAGSTWWALKRKHINILCVRNAFSNADDRGKWMGELFETLSTWTRKQIMPKVYPFAFFGDEAHWFNAGQKITSDSNRNLLSELITEHALEIRAYGGRLILFAQGYKNLPPATRENLPTTLLCRGAKISSDENNTLSAFNDRTSKYQPNQGLFVYDGGFTYPEGFPWPFPFFPMPKIKVTYYGEFDNKSQQAQLEQEITQELTPDLSKYQAIVQNLKGYEIVKDISKYDIPRIETE